MQIGKPGKATSGISTADAASVTVRGRDLAVDLIGNTGFTAYFYLLLTGRESSDNQKFFLDAILVAIAEHGLVPSVQAAFDFYTGALPGAGYEVTDRGVSTTPGGGFNGVLSVKGNGVAGEIVCTAASGANLVAISLNKTS